MASGMYLAFVRDTTKEPVRDVDGNIIFDKNEQRLLLLSHVYSMLDARGLSDAKLQLLSVFVADNRKIKNEADLMVEMLVVIDFIKKFKSSSDQMLKESSEHFFKDFQFSKKLNPVQKYLVFSWYVERIKAIDLVFQSVLDKHESN